MIQLHETGDDVPHSTTIQDTLHDVGSIVYDLGIVLSEWLISTVGFFDGSPETVLGVLILGVLVWVIIS